MNLKRLTITLGMGVAALCLYAQTVEYRNVQKGPVVDLYRFQFTLNQGNVTSGSLSTPGAKTLTIRPCPLGVNGSDANHYLYISGGTGTAEDVLMTVPADSGCVSGASSGKISFTTSYAHTGAWTITSSTNGLREGVLYLLGLGTGGELRLPYGNVTTRKGIVMEGAPAVTISGCGPWCSTVILDSSATSATVFSCNASTCLVNFKDFTIAGHSAHTAGFAIKIQNSSSGLPKIQNVRAVDTAGGFNVSNADYVQILDSYYDQVSNTGALYGILIDGGSSDVEIIGGRYAAQQIDVSTMLDYGILVAGADGLTISNVMLRGNIGLGIEPVLGGGSLLLGSVFVNNSIIDTCRTNGVRILSTGSPTGSDFFGNIYFNNNHIASAQAMQTGDLVSIDTSSMGSNYSGINFTGNFIANSTRSGIAATGVNGLRLTGNTSLNNDVANGGGYGIYLNGGSAISVTGNLLQDTRAVPLQDYGLLATGTIPFLNITGNSAIGNASGAYFSNATLTNGVMQGNIGSDDLIPQVSSAATLTLPSSLPKTMRMILSSATVGIMNTPIGNGDTRTFICDSGITFTATASTWGIAQTLPATTANQLVTCVAFTGTNRWVCR